MSGVCIKGYGTFDSTERENPSVIFGAESWRWRVTARQLAEDRLLQAEIDEELRWPDVQKDGCAWMWEL